MTKNLSNAYVSGLKEDLKMQGTEFNQINSVFHVGYVVGQIPNNIAIQKIDPRIYLTCTVVIWGFLTLGLAFVTNWHQVMIIEFFAACFESSTFVGTQYILGSWYNQEEIGKRTAIFAASGQAGNMFSGILQAAIYKNLGLLPPVLEFHDEIKRQLKRTPDGTSGLAGWRWLFVIDFLITIPIAILGFFIFPGHPSTKTRFLTPKERALAIERLPEVTLKRGTLGWSLIRRVFASWEFWMLSTLITFGGALEMYSANSLLKLYLKYLKTYSIEEINYIPTAIYGIAMMSILLCTWYADYLKQYGGRWHVIAFLSITAIISAAIMLDPPSIGAKIFALLFNGITFGLPAVVYAWTNDLLRKDDAKRGIIIGMMNASTIAFSIWWPLLFYNAAQGPEWRKGSYALIAVAITTVIALSGVVYLERRDRFKSQNSSNLVDIAHLERESVSPSKA